MKHLYFQGFPRSTDCFCRRDAGFDADIDLLMVSFDHINRFANPYDFSDSMELQFFTGISRSSRDTGISD